VHQAAVARPVEYTRAVACFEQGLETQAPRKPRPPVTRIFMSVVLSSLKVE